jgi:hypothetical protein
VLENVAVLFPNDAEAMPEGNHATAGEKWIQIAETINQLYPSTTMSVMQCQSKFKNMKSNMWKYEAARRG